MFKKQYPLLKTKVHLYYLIFGFFVGVISGVFLSMKFQFTFSNLLIYFVACLGLVSLIWHYKFLVVVICVCGIVLGFYRGNIYTNNKHQLSKYYQKTIVISGQIAEDVDIGKEGEKTIKLTNAKVNSLVIKGNIYVSLSTNHNLKRSDFLVIKGKLGPGFGSYFGSVYRAEIIDYQPASSSDRGLKTRDWFAGLSAGKLSEPERSLGLGYLLGMKTNLPELLDNQIRILGLTHVVVASGYNLTILVIFARRIFKNLSKYLASLASFGMIFGFILVSGFSASMVRAGLVAGLSLLAWYYGRRINPLMILAISAGLTLLIKPSYSWGDLGWYLSFLAFFGILVLAPLIHNFFWGKVDKISYFRELIISTLSAQIMTLPLILHVFNYTSVYALLANILILPAVPLAMLLLFVGGILSLVLPFMASLAHLPAEIILLYCTKVINYLAGLPHSMSEIKLSFLQMLLGYILIILTVLIFRKITKHKFYKNSNQLDIFYN